jgi:ribosomal RNA-processing protein 8
MFAVKGWSLPTAALKTQIVEEKKKDQPIAEGGAGTKRKRGKKEAKVNENNVAALWESVVEGKTSIEDQRESKKQKKSKKPTKTEEATAPSAEVEEDTEETAAAPAAPTKKQGRKASKEAKAQTAAKTTEESKNVQVAAPKPSQPLKPAKAAPQLTPLQAAMRQKLISARFRHLNQTLYTSPSANALQLFSDNPEMFHEYHEGFRRQVEVWPENPVDSYIKQIRGRGKVKSFRGKPVNADNDVAPLPRTSGVCHIADLGCGDAMITQTLDKDKAKLKLQISSFDLQNPSPLVTKADIANLPLEDDSVDVAIFCLALMGTNWIDFIEEAYRVLHWKGELWVGEIKSRFGRVSGKNQRVVHSVGNRKKVDKKTLKKQEAEADDAELMVEVDGNDNVSGETDVSAFVEVLRKRGFALQGENAVDLSNRMFVKMTFVKALTPIKGKCVPIPKGMEAMGQTTWKPKQQKRAFGAEEDDVPASSESAVLKPCVYKQR